VAQRFAVPVYLYEDAAVHQYRRHLSSIRRGGIDGIAARMREPEWYPDFGEPHAHPTAGVTAIGARPILIAYNVNLASDQLQVAKRIARVIRESNGGFPAVKAMGVPLADRGVVQVSMNLTDYHVTSMTTVFDAVQREAAADGIPVLDSEIVGLAPAEALPPDPVARLKLSPADADRILEKRLGVVSKND
jgi:glutamate formiminotransferase/glutamate formiminotransferase/formiminotetrahydrofolate cyclodeaminase